MTTARVQSLHSQICELHCFFLDLPLPVVFAVLFHRERHVFPRGLTRQMQKMLIMVTMMLISAHALVAKQTLAKLTQDFISKP